MTAEVAVAALIMTGLGVGGYYALSYQPTYETAPRSTTASTTLNLTGLAALLAAPAIAGRFVCSIGRRSADYEGSCGYSIAFAYLGTLAAGIAFEATFRKQPPNCYDCAIPGPSAAAVLISYIAGVTTGAVVGWNLTKRRKDDLAALEPIFRAGPPPEALANWTDPTLGTSAALRIQVPLIAFAF